MEDDLAPPLRLYFNVVDASTEKSGLMPPNYGGRMRRGELALRRIALFVLYREQ
jgi:hypothetical protein